MGTLEEIHRILSGPPTDEEFAKAITNLSSEQYYSMETVDGLARKYGHFEDPFTIPIISEIFLRQIQQLRPQDVLKVAKKYLLPQTLTSVLMAPPQFEEAGRALLTKFESDFKKMRKELGSKVE